MIYLLDTDSVVFMTRGLNPVRKAAVRQRALRLANKCQSHQQAGDQIGLSAITVSELEFGARCCLDDAAEMVAVRKVVRPFDIFDFDAEKCPMHYGQIRRDLQLAGIPIGAMDYLLAAHALALGATMVTNKVDHFDRIAGLKVVNWS
jgi:tRNA(fMet)-specific endonuclease VapC